MGGSGTVGSCGRRSSEGEESAAALEREGGGLGRRWREEGGMGRRLEREGLGQGGGGAYILLGLGGALAGFVGPRAYGDGGPAGEGRLRIFAESHAILALGKEPSLSKENFNKK
jgi:hypothetical protein